jgi:hypothetical protein
MVVFSITGGLYSVSLVQILYWDVLQIGRKYVFYNVAMVTQNGGWYKKILHRISTHVLLYILWGL